LICNETRGRSFGDYGASAGVAAEMKSPDV
jgi:hypothetical protein